MARKSVKAHTELDIDRPERFLNHERRAQKIGVGLLALFVIAGAAGAFGSGPLSDTTIRAGNLTVAFERFTRQSVRTRIEISILGASDSTQEVRLSREFLTHLENLEVRPEHALKRIDAEAAVFEVPALNGTAILQLVYEASSYGVFEADVTVSGQPSVRVRQIVFF